jgi:hypothetical protein
MDYVLRGIGVTPNNTNRAAMGLWTLSEDRSGGLNGGTNPLAICGASCPNTTRCLAQCDPGNCPIMAYKTLKDGLDCTIMFINGRGSSARDNKGPLQGIITALGQVSDKPDGSIDVAGLDPIFNAINISGWCAGCQNGHYPEVLFAALGKTSEFVAGSAKSGFGPGTPDLPDISGPVKAGVKAVGKVVTAPLSAIEVMKKFFDTITSVSFWKRVGLGLLGVVLMVVGIVLILSETKVGQTVEGAATVAALA